MRASQALFNAAKKQSGFNIPVELTPLFVAMGVACVSATYFTYKKLAYDGSLRLSRNPQQTHKDVDQYAKEAKE
ncbi:hypothetical protein WICPIJ_003395 [Wickerhamomyces pijperi]|uniref:Uncharacterized protein n=1 Tax=Wickerhamomyces pijperi TaxID=599730 RepID=A0A9P8Q7R8_WICPI|nr:hypothetical protein WICPIJ_003395 [Wickerhamomyces pijperi]